MKMVCFYTCLFFTLFGIAQNKPKATRILFVFDASNSMKAPFENTTRMEGAKKLFLKFIDSLSKDKTMSFALRMYGSTIKYPPGDCKDSKLVVPFTINNLQQIKQKVIAAKPTGITPIEHSLTESANDFPDKKTNNIVILITDGIEECGGDPCAARKKLMEKGIIFKPFIIGIGLTPEQIKSFECVGNYFDIEDNTTFSNIQKIIQQQKLNKTTAQVNLLNSKSLPLETNVNNTFIDVSKSAYKYNFIHTLNYQNNPDTLYIDDYPTYKVIANTIPPVESKEVKLTQGKHTIIPIDAPQGTLAINRPAGVYNYNEKVKIVIRKIADPKIIHVQQFNTQEKLIVGTYNLEILTLPRIYMDNIEILEFKQKIIDIPNAGTLQIKALEAGDGCIMVKRNGKLEWVTNLSTQTIQNFNLQPGQYVCVWRSKSLKGSIYTIEKNVTINSDSQSYVDFYK